MPKISLYASFTSTLKANMFACVFADAGGKKRCCELSLGEKDRLKNIYGNYLSN